VGDLDAFGGGPAVLSYAADPGFLGGDGEAFFDVSVVKCGSRADAVFEGGNDFCRGQCSPRVGGEDDGDVEGRRTGKPLIWTSPSCMMLKRATGSCRRGRDLVMRRCRGCAGEETVVHGELGAEVRVGAGGFDGVDVADESATVTSGVATFLRSGRWG